MADLDSPGLVVHLFAVASGAGEQRLRGIWDTLGDRLGMPARTVGEAEVRTAAGEPLRQVVWRLEHDVRCLSVALTGGTWTELDKLWRDCAGLDLGWALGECRLFVAYTRSPPAQRHMSDVLEALPDSPSYARFAVGQAVALWETGCERDDRRERTFAVLAARDREAEVDAWLWTRGDDRMAPLARHLMHAAKVRYELRVYGGGEQFRAARDQVDEQAGQVLALLDSDVLLSARARLAHSQAASGGLIWAATRLREMQRTVEIARFNMREELLADDKALADWFVLRLEDDLGYADAVRERAREIGVIADQAISERLQRRAEESERRWQRFGVLEAAIIGAAGMMLAAVQSLNYTVPVPDWSKPVIVGGLGLIAFGLAAFGFLRTRRRR